MKKILIEVRRAIYRTAAFFDKVLLRKMQTVAVCYHGIGTGKSKYSVNPDSFQAQMNYLSGRSDFLVTFDDGDPGIIQAADILEKYRINPILFINSANINRNLLAFALDRGWRIGSHARTHRDLTRLSQRVLNPELEESKKTLEKESGHPIDYFAYPYGKRNNRTDTAVRQAGYRKAYGTNVCPGDGEFVIPRLVVTGDMGLAEFKDALSPTAFAIRKIIFSVLEKFV